MRVRGWVIGTAAFAGCASAQGWQPRPEAVPEPSQTIAQAPAADWQDIADEDLLVMELKDRGRVVIQLAPAFAPVHVANVRAFARGGWWDKASIYRLQDNYVAQWGNGDAAVPLPPGVVAKPPAEYVRTLAGLDPRPLGYPDAYAPAAGYASGWPIGYDDQRRAAWLTHCYGSVGVGRDLTPDTGTGGELYAVIGHAPRHLDRNIAVIGRVIEGMDQLSSIPRGKEALGFIADKTRHVPITRIRLVADMPAAQRPHYQAMRTDSASFSTYVKGRANRSGDFFQVPAGGVDLCNAPVPVRARP